MKFPSGITNLIIIRYIGNLAEQVIKGVTKMVISRSRQFSIFRVAITAGIAQAAPDIKGITLFPFSPNGLIILSIKKTTRLIYPLSSSREMNKNKIAICGTKTKTLPNPGIIPSTNNEVKFPSGSLFSNHLPNSPKPESNQSIG